MTTETDNETLAAIAVSLANIDDTLKGLLDLLTAREAAFKERKSSFGDRKPYARKSYDRDDDRGDRKPYARKSYDRDDDRGGERGSFRPGPKKSFGPKKTYGEKKSYAPRAGGDDERPAPRKKYKGGY